MILRQAYPLLLAHACGMDPIRGRTRFQKMMFLLHEEMEKEGAGGRMGLRFVPHYYGPYSGMLQRCQWCQQH